MHVLEEAAAAAAYHRIFLCARIFCRDVAMLELRRVRTTRLGEVAYSSCVEYEEAGAAVAKEVYGEIHGGRAAAARAERSGLVNNLCGILFF